MNARMRGLQGDHRRRRACPPRCPGVAAAHTDLPVIGVPISGKTLGGLDALLSAARCRPACRSAAWRSTARGTRGSWPPASSTPDASRLRRDPPLHPPGDRRGLDPQRRMEAWLQVELAAIEAWAEEGVVPGRGGRECRDKASFTVEAVEERERTTGHDVAAFVDVVAASIGEPGRWLHYGLTSSDVLDTALALQLRTGRRDRRRRRPRLSGCAGRARARASRHALRRPHPRRPRRAHDLRAEARGLRLRGRPQPAAASSDAFEQGAVGKLSGAVGTYASVPPAIEASVLDCSGLRREDVSTQVVPRDRHASCSPVALAGAGLERFATEMRHLQRTEVREVEEPFGAGQKGSSAMPHKRNPIVAERVSGPRARAARLRAAGIENVALWHERDISHSGGRAGGAAGRHDPARLHAAPRDPAGRGHDRPRRPDAREPRLTHGALFSQRALTALVESGMSATTPTASSRRTPSAPGTRGTSFRELIAAARRTRPRRGLRLRRLPRARPRGDGAPG